MAQPHVTPYEGSEPYIFISYSHKDMDRVAPILDRLDDEGFRLWYDEGIDPGSEWPESIARHLAGARCCLAFISDNSIRSQNCRREINFALSRTAGFLSVILEECQMSPGMELQISTYQALMYHKYADKEGFYKRLVGLDVLQSCRRPAPVTPEPTPASEPAPVIAPPPESAPAAPAPASEPEPVSGPAPERRPKKARAEKPPRDPVEGKKKKLLVPVLLILAALLIAAGSALLLINKSVTIDGKKYTYPTFTDVELDAGDMRRLRVFRNNTYASFTRCTFEPGALDALPLRELTYMSMDSCEGVDSLAFLSDLSKLGTLTIKNCGLTDDLLPAALPVSRLSRLDLSGNALTRVPAFAGTMDISALNLSGNALTDVAPLAGCTSLTELLLGDNGLTDLSPLSGLEKLRTLSAPNNAITDAEALRGLIYMEKLDLRGNAIADWSALENMTRLTQLRIGGNSGSAGIGSVTPCAAVLTELDIGSLTLTEELSSLLEQCTALTVLRANACGLDDDSVSFLAQMPALQELNLAGNSLRGCRGLSALGSLRYLNLSGNDLISLEGFPAPAEAETPLALLLHDNALASLRGLPEGYKYTLLTIYSNALGELSPLYERSGTAIVLDITEETDLGALRESDFPSYYVYVASVPLARKADLETAFPSVKYFDADDPGALAQLLRERNVGEHFSFD